MIQKHLLFCNNNDIIIKVSHLKQCRRVVFNITNLARIRKLRGITQRKLSVMSGVHRVSIARYETGRVSPNVRVLERLANALSVPIDALVDKKAG